MTSEQHEFSKPPENTDKEKPFAGSIIYYSGSIRGTPEPDPTIPMQLVQYMTENGAEVFSEHVAAQGKKAQEAIRAKHTGISPEEFWAVEDPDVAIHDCDIEWVDQATHVVALVNAPSTGVGYELREAVVKPRLGLNYTPVLCLIREDLLSTLSAMVKGVSAQEHPDWHVKTYKDIEGAKQSINDFLTGKIPSRINQK